MGLYQSFCMFASNPIKTTGMLCGSAWAKLSMMFPGGSPKPPASDDPVEPIDRIDFDRDPKRAK